MSGVTHEPECHVAREVSGDQWFCCCEQLHEREADHLAALERVRVETLREARDAVERLPKMNLNHTPVQTVHLQEPLYVVNRDQALAAIDRLINAATTGDTDD